MLSFLSAENGLAVGLRVVSTIKSVMQLTTGFTESQAVTAPTEL